MHQTYSSGTSLHSYFGPPHQPFYPKTQTYAALVSSLHSAYEHTPTALTLPTDTLTLKERLIEAQRNKVLLVVGEQAQ